MLRKKILALLLAAAMALSLLAGCGGGESAAQVLLKLLDGKYPNISVEIDPDLEADLRQAISTAEAENAGDDAAVIRAALETLLGSNITFRYLGDGQKGDTAFDLIFYAGSDPDKAAQAAYNQWNLVFSNVPADGQYGTSLAMVETNSGVWMLVKATVEKAGTVDKPDDDPEPEPEPEQPTIVKGTGFTYFVNDNKVTVDGTEGLQELFTGGYSDKALLDAREAKFAGITITLKAGDPYTVDATGPLADAFNGILQGEDGAKIILSGASRTQGLFNTIESDGQVLNVDIEVSGTINVSKTGDTYAYAGVVAGQNYGAINGCTVTISNSIEAHSSSGSGFANAGGLVGRNENSGEISGCEAIVNGTISAERTGGNSAYAGGIAGYNYGTIDESCTVEVTGTIKATGSDGASAHTGGIAGRIDNVTSITDCSVTLEGGTIQAISNGNNPGIAFAGGMVGSITFYNPLNCGPATGSGSITATAGNNYSATVTVAPGSGQTIAKDGDRAYAGTTCGSDAE